MDRNEARAKAAALVGRMTLEEKASQLRYDAPAIERLGIPAYNWWGEALHGVARGGTATSFPQAIGIAAGFDPTKKTFFSILGVSYYLTLDVFTDTLRQMSELSSLGSEVVFDYPIKTGDFPQRVTQLEEITAQLGEVMRGGFDYNEVSRALYSLGFQIDTYMPPAKVQKEYFDGRADGMRAFENVSLISASYTAGYDYE